MLSLRILFWALWYRAFFKTTPFHKLIKDISTIKQPAWGQKNQRQDENSFGLQCLS